MGTAGAWRLSNAVMWPFLLSVIALASVGCSSSHHSSSAAPSTTIASATTTFHPQSLCHGPKGCYGSITGRYYSDGGPPPPSGVAAQLVHPIVGTITISNAETHTTYQPHEDSRGYFKVVVPAGTYGVMAGSRGGVAPAMTDTVTVTAGSTVNADLGIHFP